MESLILHTLRCSISGEAVREIWCWSLYCLSHARGNNPEITTNENKQTVLDGVYIGK